MSTKNSKKEDYQKNFSNEMTTLIKKMDKYIANEVHVSEIKTEFFIMFLLEQEDSMLYKAVNGFLSGAEIETLHDVLFETIEGDISYGAIPNKKPDFSKEMKNFFLKADNERESMGCQFTTSDHILLAVLSKTGKSNTKKIINHTGLTYDILYDSAVGLHDFTEAIADRDGSDEVVEQTFEIPFPFTGEMFIISSSPSQSLINPPQQSKKKGAGIQFCKNLNGLASIGKIDTLIGRRDIISEMERVFARRKCNNVILVGNSGAGKSSIVEGLAKLIYEKEAPISLLGKTIYSLKVNDITSGTNMRGMFEERIGGVFQQLRQQKNCILFIDDAHTIINQRKNDEYDIMPIIIENITNGDLQVILATTQSGYRDIANSSPDFKRRFNRINVDPLSLKDTIEVLNGIKTTYEEYHSVKYADDAISACAKLAERYIPEISLPTSAIDIIDESGAMKKLEFINHSEIVEKMMEVNALIKKKNEYIKKDKIDKAEEAETKIRELKADITEFEKEYGKPINEVTVDDVYKTISQHTGIPVSKVTVSERKMLSHIEDTLKSVVVGQDEAVQAIANAIRRNKVGLYKKQKTLASMFFAGPTGVGKCVSKDTLITVKNKNTGAIEKVTIENFIKMIKK